MVLRRSKGYQDIDGSSSQVSSQPELPPNGLPQDIEMASVSVVPDGNCFDRENIV